MVVRLLLQRQWGTMQEADQSGLRNRLLASLAPQDYRLLQPHLAPVDLPKGIVLVEPGRPIEHVWFPEKGIGSIIAITPEGECAEIGLFGNDGMAGLPIVLGSDSTPHRVLIQVEGAGFRMPSVLLGEALGQSRTLSTHLLRYAHALSVQTAYTALSNALHTVEERLARWLLMSHDRHDSDEIPLTHDFIALMLAVRRPSVTTALHMLEGARLISAFRGKVVIRDRAGLEELAQQAYGVPEAEYERLIGSLGRSGKGG